MHKSISIAVIALFLIASPFIMFGTSNSNLFSKAMATEDGSESDIIIKSNVSKDKDTSSDDESKSKSSDDESKSKVLEATKSSDDESKSKSSDDESKSKVLEATKSSDDES